MKGVVVYDPEIPVEVFYKDGEGRARFVKPGETFSTEGEAAIVYAQYIQKVIATRLHTFMIEAIKNIIDKSVQSSDPLGMCEEKIKKMLGVV